MVLRMPTAIVLELEAAGAIYNAYSSIDVYT